VKTEGKKNGKDGKKSPSKALLAAHNILCRRKQNDDEQTPSTRSNLVCHG